MQMINDLFTGYLSKFNAKVVDEDVMIEFTITHLSKNEDSQVFLNDFSEEFQNGISDVLRNPEWDNVKFTKVIPGMNIKFDVADVNDATLNTIRITQKETASDLTFKYDLTFVKKQEKDLDTWFATYLKHKDEDDDGKKHLTEYDIEISVN